jgi:anti-anti-sigma regulatory factor
MTMLYSRTELEQGCITFDSAYAVREKLAQKTHALRTVYLVSANDLSYYDSFAARVLFYGLLL